MHLIGLLFTIVKYLYYKAFVAKHIDHYLGVRRSSVKMHQQATMWVSHNTFSDYIPVDPVLNCLVIVRIVAKNDFAIDC
jgi:hypothetical protein